MIVKRSNNQQPIQTTLRLSDEDLEQLREALGREIDADLTDFLSAVARVSAEMLLEELLGRADYPTKVAARQARLLGLVLQAFGGAMPPASVVGALFHLTPTAAATLLTTTAARYRTDLKPARDAAVVTTLKGNVDVASDWNKVDHPDDLLFDFRCVDLAVVATIREALNASDEPVSPLNRSPEATNVYDFDASMFPVLEHAFGLTLKDVLKAELHGKYDELAAKAATQATKPKGIKRFARRNRA